MRPSPHWERGNSREAEFQGPPPSERCGGGTARTRALHTDRPGLSAASRAWEQSAAGRGHGVLVREWRGVGEEGGPGKGAQEEAPSSAVRAQAPGRE